jgi:hypothetical protein
MGYITISQGSWMDVNAWTVEALIKHSAAAWGAEGIATRDQEYTVRPWSMRIAAGGSPNMHGWNASGNLYMITSGTALNANTEYLVALKWDNVANYMRYYINGTKVGEIATTGNAQTGSQGFKFGRGSTLNAYPYVGNMSHTAYYGTALSDTRLLAHAQAIGLA